MKTLNFDNLSQCIQTLEKSLERFNQSKDGSIDHEVFRNAVIKSFELTLETIGKLLRKALKSYVATPRFVDELNYKDVFRHAGKHALLTNAEVDRWFAYRDNRNDTAHDYGIAFTKTTLKLLPQFLIDAKNLKAKLESM
jgi:hypothetical protein